MAIIAGVIIMPTGIYVHQKGGHWSLSPETVEKMRQSRIGTKLSEETKMKIKITLTGKKRPNTSQTLKRMYNSGELIPVWKDKKLSIEHIEKLRIVNTGKKLSEETRNKIRAKHKGIKLSFEHKQKIRASTLKYIEETRGSVNPNIGRYEKQILDCIENSIKILILRQYRIGDFFLDGYCKERNIVFEVDEKPKNREKDVEREEYIKNKLKCVFIRIPTYNS